MIYLNKDGVSDDQFKELLEKTRLLSIKQFTDPNGELKPEPIKFEMSVFERMKEASQGSVFAGHIVKAGLHAFPDIVAKKYFGAEVKMTAGNGWISTGNSVLETTRVKDVERIYLFFGKFGGGFDAKYRPYHECLYDVGVTHSPRYKINMNLKDGQTIFDKIGVDYETIRKELNPIARFKEYYKKLLKEDEELWWIDQDDQASVSPVIRSYRGLSDEEKERYLTEVMVLFPEIFGDNPAKFERPAAYLITNYNAVTSNLRDLFTAGGKVSLSVKDKTINAARILFELSDRAKMVRETILTMDEQKLADHWRVKSIDKDRLGQWEKLLASKSKWKQKGITAVDVFEDGLR